LSQLQKSIRFQLAEVNSVKCVPLPLHDAWRDHHRPSNCCDNVKGESHPHPATIGAMTRSPGNAFERQAFVPRGRRLIPLAEA
jgi:hypothetical protein